MKKAIALAFLAVACAATAEVALVCSPGTVASGTATNTVVVPRGMTGWAEIDIVAAALPTNKPAIYTLATMDATGTNIVPVAGIAPFTNAAAVATIQVPSAAINSNLVFVTTVATNTTRAAVLRYTPTYPERR